MTQPSRLTALNHALHDADHWFRELGERPPFESQESAYTFFRAVVHALRDRLEMHEAVHFAQQMPTLVRGIYFDGWRPSATPGGERNRAEFFESVAENLGPGRPAGGLDVAMATRTVFEFLTHKLDPGQIRHVRGQLPASVQALWPTKAGLDDRFAAAD